MVKQLISLGPWFESGWVDIFLFIFLIFSPLLPRPVSFQDRARPVGNKKVKKEMKKEMKKKIKKNKAEPTGCNPPVHPTHTGARP